MIKPNTATGYSNYQVELVLMTCRYISTILGDFMDDLVIVGGLVPSLIINQSNLPTEIEPHVGTMDLDIGLSLAILDDKLYQTITERLRNAGFEPDINENGNATNQRWQINEGGKVTIDFLIPPIDKNDRGGKIKNIESDFAALIAEGLPLAFQDYEHVNLDGKTIKGETIKNRNIRVCGPGAFVVLKAFALNNRGENKDAYDLYYTIRNYGRGPESVAARFLKLGKNENCEKALSILKDNFLDIDSVGVRRTVEFLLGVGETDENLQAEVMGFIRSFISKCEV